MIFVVNLADRLNGLRGTFRRSCGLAGLDDIVGMLLLGFPTSEEEAMDADPQQGDDEDCRHSIDRQLRPGATRDRGGHLFLGVGDKAHGAIPFMQVSASFPRRILSPGSSTIRPVARLREKRYFRKSLHPAA